MKIDPDKDFQRLVVVETGKTRVIGLVRENPPPGVPMVLDRVMGLTIAQGQDGSHVPAIASMDYNRFYIDNFEIGDIAWSYRPADQDPSTQASFKMSFFGALQMMEQEKAAADSANIQLAPADAMAKIDILAKEGKLPPGIIPGK
jgi:hypothetical protein